MSNVFRIYTLLIIFYLNVAAIPAIAGAIAGIASEVLDYC